MVNRTIWREPQGKYILGTVSPSGAEMALSGKWIGEGAQAMSVNQPGFLHGKWIGDAVHNTYPTFDMRLPARAPVDPTSLAIGAAIVALLYSLAKR